MCNICVQVCEIQNERKTERGRNLYEIPKPHFSSFERICHDRVDRKYQTKVHLCVLLQLSGNETVETVNTQVFVARYEQE